MTYAPIAQSAPDTLDYLKSEFRRVRSETLNALDALNAMEKAGKPVVEADTEHLNSLYEEQDLIARQIVELVCA